MRQIQEAIIHCSDSDYDHHDSIEVIRDWHLHPKPPKKPFPDVGYHYFIRGNGTIEIGRQLDKPGFHCQGHNMFSVGICFHGKHNFKEVQFKAGAKLLTMLLCIWPQMKIFPHNEYNKAKTCPNFAIEKVIPFV